MRNILLAFILLGIFSCKKKKDNTEDTPPVVTPTTGNTMTAKVNGNAWSVSGNNSPSSKVSVGVNSGSPKVYVFQGQTSSSLYQNVIWLYTPYTTGTVDLRTTPGCDAIYFDNTGLSYHVKTGTVNITAMDTSHVKSTKCDKFKATFSFTTDSIGGTAYKVTEGSIDFVAP